MLKFALVLLGLAVFLAPAIFLLWIGLRAVRLRGWAGPLIALGAALLGVSGTEPIMMAALAQAADPGTFQDIAINSGLAFRAVDFLGLLFVGLGLHAGIRRFESR